MPITLPPMPAWSKTFALTFVAFSIIAIICWRSYSKYAKRAYNANHERKAVPSGGGKPATLMLFAASWCPACKAFRPAWEQAKADLDGASINGYDVLFVEYDCSDRNDPDSMKAQEKYGIKGYPTMKLKYDGNVVDFECERTPEGIRDYLTELLS